MVIADFNGDRVDDIFVADHGYDAYPFPGYQNTLVLSAPGGKLVDATDNLILYLQTIIKKSEDAANRFYPIITDTFQFISKLPDERFERFVRSFFGLKRLAHSLYDHESPQVDYQSVNRLLARCFRVTYDYWLEETDPMIRFLKEAEVSAPTPYLEALFSPISHQTLASCRAALVIPKPNR